MVEDEKSCAGERVFGGFGRIVLHLGGFWERLVVPQSVTG